MSEKLKNKFKTFKNLQCHRIPQRLWTKNKQNTDIAQDVNGEEDWLIKGVISWRQHKYHVNSISGLDRAVKETLVPGSTHGLANLML